MTWRLRMAAAQREVWTGAALRRLLAERAGVDLSPASISALLTGQPRQLKLSTLAALCTRGPAQAGQTPGAVTASGTNHAPAVKVCVDCGTVHRFKGSTRCHSCYDHRRRTGPTGVCTRCAKHRPIHDPAGRCDWCVYACRPRPTRTVPPCVGCGQTRPIIAHGNCNRCLQKNPATTRTYADGLASRLGPARPQWYYAFVAHIVERYTPSEARLRLRELGRLLPTTADPSELVTAATHPDGRLAPLGRALDEFFDALGPRPATGDTEARAAGCRARVIDTLPEPLRPAVTAFSAAELANRERARRARARILTNQTLLIHLQVVADFARHTPNITDWASVAQRDIEAFLVPGPDPCPSTRRHGPLCKPLSPTATTSRPPTLTCS